MAANRTPNTRLRRLIGEARWTGQALARAVNRAGAEAGLTLTYDRTAVAHWLAGVRPSAQVGKLVAEVLSRRLGRVLTLQDVGFGAPGMPPVAETARVPATRPDSVARLAELCAADADPARRAALRELVFSVAALIGAAGRGYHPPEPPPPPVAPGRERAQMVRAMTGMFSAADGSFGGGHIRPALTAYLSGHVVRWLREPARPGAWNELAAAVAELVYLAAFVSYDCALSGLAQRYYLTALGLAEQAGAAALHATILRGMSVQAYGLRHHRAALRLAEAAAGRATMLPAPCAAALFGQLAVAEAVNGRLREAGAQLSRAERLLDRSGAADGPVGAFHSAALHYQAAEVQAAAGNPRGAITLLSTSILQRPGEERRSRAVTTARLAQLQLEVGYLEAACATVAELCDDYPYLSSVRVDAALDGLRLRLRSFSGNGEARAAAARIATVRAGA